MKKALDNELKIDDNSYIKTNKGKIKMKHIKSKSKSKQN